jgi:hypothetical protein
MQAFDAWSKSEKAMEAGLDPGQLVEMRTKIAEEFGLVEQGAAELIADMMSEWDSWAENSGENSEQVVEYMGAVLDATEAERQALVELTAQTWWIRLRWDTDPYPSNVPRPRDPDDFGGMNAGGAGGTNITNNDTYVFNTPHGPAAVLDAQRRARRRQMGRIM